MPDKKLTDSEIPNIKELLEYKAKVGCQNCDLIGKGCCSTCVNSLIKSFIGLFDRLQAENENYSKNNRQMTSDILKLYKELEQAKTENEELKQENGILFREVKMEVDNRDKAKAEAVKECLAKVKEKAYTECDITGYKYQVVQIEEIDNLLKEMG